MATLNVGNLGEFLREQRRTAQLSLRQLADAAGVSNPYLSQIERGLRKPSADILQQLAKALRISAETLYVQAGILDERDRAEVEVSSAILTDPTITERQKQVLLQIYESFRKENGTGWDRQATAAHHDDPAPDAGQPDIALSSLARAEDRTGTDSTAPSADPGTDIAGGDGISTHATEADPADNPADNRAESRADSAVSGATGSGRRGGDTNG
ncbi:helix-turn-helix domain-containing protein [Streptomyces zagrosensis]|uniref:Transcriptional regulator with XRE-family HTH domain n=1 Tax=Streptomyces zagrosensis TaxID=1042984 RepID=A0A7W9QIY8_9ACTN|nr:helix-turn-helix transcriptional regulator [Streptomyces zagrosensis]MBB5940107.1 transcriptional regulator with XRE-family HTH domain [Streptomyces zagrosensis]